MVGEDFRQFQALSERFPSSEYDVLVVVEGPQLLERESLSALRDAVIELQFIEGLRGLISLFSARASPEPGKLPPPLFPFEFPEGEAYDELIRNVRANRILDGKLLSTDGQLTLIVIALDPLALLVAEHIGVGVRALPQQARRRRRGSASRPAGLEPPGRGRRRRTGGVRRSPPTARPAS